MKTRDAFKEDRCPNSVTFIIKYVQHNIARKIQIKYVRNQNSGVIEMYRNKTQCAQLNNLHYV